MLRNEIIKNVSQSLTGMDNQYVDFNFFEISPAWKKEIHKHPFFQLNPYPKLSQFPGNSPPYRCSRAVRPRTSFQLQGLQARRGTRISTPQTPPARLQLSRSHKSYRSSVFGGVIVKITPHQHYGGPFIPASGYQIAQAA